MRWLSWFCQEDGEHASAPGQRARPLMLWTVAHFWLKASYGYMEPCRQHWASLEQDRIRQGRAEEEACCCPHEHSLPQEKAPDEVTSPPGGEQAAWSQESPSRLGPSPTSPPTRSAGGVTHWKLPGELCPRTPSRWPLC